MRYKGAIVNSYTYVKAIAEEARGLAVECSVPIISATQTTRSGYGNSDPDLTDTSESFGLPATADFMFALISTEELNNRVASWSNNLRTDTQTSLPHENSWWELTDPK